MITFGSICFLIWMMALCRQLDRPSRSRGYQPSRRALKLPEKELTTMPFWHPWNKDIDIPPVIR